MNRKVKGVVFVIAVLVFAGPALAESNRTPGLDRREEVQERRIEEGIASGELNEREAARLERGEERLERHEAAAKADGKVTPVERKRLHKEADRMSKRIHRQKHDAKP
jgi:flagellar biosynthesis GTPase FlhF